MKKAIFLMAIVVLFSGCTQLRQLRHLSRLLTLKRFSENKEEQQAIVEAYDEKFKKLAAAAEGGSLAEYPDQASFLENFDEPIYRKRISQNDQPVDKWMYRYSSKLLGSEKVYLFFDSSGNLIDWDYMKPKGKKEVSDGKGLEKTTTK